MTVKKGLSPREVNLFYMGMMNKNLTMARCVSDWILLSNDYFLLMDEKKIFINISDWSKMR